MRIGLHYGRHCKVKGIAHLITFKLIIFLSLLLIKAGDIELNQGPGTSQNDTGSVDDSLISSYFSVVHYNIQSILNKVDSIGSVLRNFNIICLTETWLGPNTTDEDLRIDDYSLYRRDRPTDNHGGVCVYIKEDIYSRRRTDLELPHVECVWVEINIHHKKILIGTFYRPHNSPAKSYIKDSINLALDCNINDIFVTGDFNLDTPKHASNQNLRDICQHFNFDQLIVEPTHFTESSSSIIDLILTSTKSSILLSGVGDPSIDQSVQHHCPVYFVLSTIRPLPQYQLDIFGYTIEATINHLHAMFMKPTGNFQKIMIWTHMQKNIIDQITALAKQHIPNKTIKIRQLDPPG